MADFSIKSSKGKGIYDRLGANVSTVLLTLNLFALGIIIYLFFNPPFLNNESVNEKVFDEVSEVVQISKNETPIIAEISKVDSIKSINSVMAEVYAKAQDGDYFIALSDKIIIFRRDGKQVIYNGPSPAQIIEARKAQLISNIKNAAQSNGISLSFDETPQVVAATDPDALKTIDSEFYADIEKNDVIVVFPKSEKILIYRSSDSSIVNSGEYKSVISKSE
jgi:hypothetical protein